MIPSAFSFDDVTTFISTFLTSPLVLVGLAAVIGLKLLPRVGRVIRSLLASDAARARYRDLKDG